ncbi:MAG: CAP domain-containing protein [Hyphomicrobiaceae bacterium]|nr:CAP domain-containing protein [Hyphomicrobiaceae bacterium]
MICNMLSAVSVITGLCSSATPQALSDKPPSFSVTVAQKMINAHRARHGLNALSVDSRLNAAAKAHSRDLARRNAISHRGSDGSYPKDRARRAGYNPRLASENVAVGYTNTADVIQSWKGSRGHNANLLRRGARHMGMGMVYRPNSGRETYWTLIIGKPR